MKTLLSVLAVGIFAVGCNHTSEMDDLGGSPDLAPVDMAGAVDVKMAVDMGGWWTRCNAGPAADGGCVECGKEGESVCHPTADNGYLWCQPGFTPASGGATCTACGAQGQPCCYAMNMNPVATCNNGLTCATASTFTCE